MTVGKVPCTYTKEMGLGCYGTFLLVPHFPAHLLATSSHSYVVKGMHAKILFLVHLLKYVCLRS
jgi:hypothetical protein